MNKGAQFVSAPIPTADDRTRQIQKNMRNAWNIMRTVTPLSNKLKRIADDKTPVNLGEDTAYIENVNNLLEQVKLLKIEK
jgi:hypothetical protein